MISSLTLINANINSKQAIDGNSGHSAVIADGSTLYLGSVGQALSTRADIASAGGVFFGFDGQDQYHTEDLSSYALASDDNGVYSSWTPAVDDHVVSVTPYSDPNAVGIVGRSAVIADHSIIELVTAGKALNVRAGTVSAGSVIFDYDNGATSRIENVAPCAFAGDNGGVYNSWTPVVGAHVLKATAYPGSNAIGIAGAALVIHFSVQSSGSTPVQTSGNPASFAEPSSDSAHHYHSWRNVYWKLQSA